MNTHHPTPNTPPTTEVAYGQFSAQLTRMNLETATRVANRLKTLLEPYCERIEIAGSVRRQKTEGIKDVELCIVPRLEPVNPEQHALFDEPNTEGRTPKT
jgi:DNA polymerase/3'-5' exonuclease PolX